MPRKIGIIHTTPVTIDPLKKLITELLPGDKLMNLLDDSILPELKEHDNNIKMVEERLMKYTKIQEQNGADIILFACSSVGEVATQAAENLSIPILRIDEAMAEKAVTEGKKIAVLATVSTTLTPTLNLLNQKAVEKNKKTEVNPILASEAFDFLSAGDKEKHDQFLVDTLEKLTHEYDIIVLAQASMASAVSRLSENQQKQCLTSPELGVNRLKKVLDGVR